MNIKIKNLSNKYLERFFLLGDIMKISEHMRKILEMAGIEEPLEEMAYPTNFNLNEFSQISTFIGRKNIVMNVYKK